MRWNTSWRRWVGVGVGLVAVLGAAGCGRRGAAGEKTYALKGEVLSVDPTRKVAAVRHDAVAGLMPAMAMEFSVSAGDAAVLRVGEHIRATLAMDAAGGGPRLSQIWPDDAAANAAIAAGARALREDTHDRGDGVYREIGEAMPDFTLYDQTGQIVQSARFRGKQIMLNFIYTGCPDPNMCPASTAKMISAQRLAKEAGIGNIEFVSITLDPQHDTPGVLKEYAEDRGIDTHNFSFLTGPESAVRDILTQFGVIDDFQGDLLKHTLSTLLIDPSGKIIWRDTGSQWDPQEFVKRMHRA